MSAPLVLVRRAVPADLAAIGRVHAQSQRDTYRLSDASRLSLDDAERVAHWRRRLARSKPMAAFVADADGAVVGFVVVSRQDGDLGTVDALHVASSHHGRGIGRRLAAAAVTALRGWGCRVAQLWVAVDNTGAREFYRRLGWRDDGGRDTHRIGLTDVSIASYRKEDLP